MLRKLWLSFLSGIILSLSFPPLKLGFLAFGGLIPFFILLQDTRYKQAIKWGYITGLFVNFGSLYWISWVTIPGAVAAILYLPVFFIIYAIFHTFIRLRLGEKYLYLCIPFLWTGIEYLRSLGVLGFPWTSLAYTQTYYLSLLQYASYTSLYGISFWIVLINVIIMLMLKNYNDLKKVVFYFIILICLFIFPWIYGKMVIPDEETAREKIRVAIIQGNIDPYAKSDLEFWEENFRIYERLSKQAATQQPQLIIWPETAMPCYLRYNTEYLTKVRNLVSELNTPLITGAHDFKYVSNNDYLTFNAAFLISPHSYYLDSYAKLHLVPFGERVPFTEFFPAFRDFLESLEMGEGNFSPGDQLKTFYIPISTPDNDSIIQTRIKVSVVICFESLFSDLVRKFIVDKGAQLLVIITNDGWFKRSAAPYHHAQAAVLRAIENRISIARSANTGVSMFIDPYGRTIKASPIFEELYLVDKVSLRNETTFFTRHGNIFSITISVLNLGPLIIALLKKDQEVAGV